LKVAAGGDKGADSLKPHAALWVPKTPNIASRSPSAAALQVRSYGKTISTYDSRCDKDLSTSKHRQHCMVGSAVREGFKLTRVVC
jgi:hypothetical protein